MLMFSIGCQAQKADTSMEKNFYLFSDTIMQELSNGFHLYQTKVQNQEGNNFILLLRNLSAHERSITIIYCDKCVLKGIPTNRFVKLENSLELPLICDYDIEYSDQLIEGGKRFTPKFGGYTIVFSTDGVISSINFEQ